MPPQPLPAQVTRTDFGAVKAAIHRKLIQKLNLDRLTEVNRDDVRREVTQILEALVVGESTPMNLQERERLATEVLDEVFGLGPLEPLLADPTVSDILVNTHKRVYVERRGMLEMTSIQFRDDIHLMSIIDRIVSAVGRRVDESSPMVDARLADGSRVNAIIPPLAVDGPCLSIRRFGRDPLTSEDLLQNNTLTEPMLELLRGCRQGAAQHPRFGRYGRRQDDVPQRSVVVHFEPRAHRHCGRRGGIAASPGPRRSLGDAPGEHRRQGRDSATATRHQLFAYAS